MDLLIILAVTADVMFAAVACGASGIRIQPLSCAVMACVSSGFIILSAAGSSYFFQNLPEDTIRWIGCLALIFLGSVQLLDNQWHALLHRLSAVLPGFLRHIAALPQDYTKADTDQNQTLSPAEAFVLAIPVSIDSLIGGLSIITDGPGLVIRFLLGFLCGYIAVYFGSRMAARIPIRSQRLRSSLCGLLLIALGIAKRVL